MTAVCVPSREALIAGAGAVALGGTGLAGYAMGHAGMAATLTLGELFVGFVIWCGLANPQPEVEAAGETAPTWPELGLVEYPSPHAVEGPAPRPSCDGWSTPTVRRLRIVA